VSRAALARALLLALLAAWSPARAGEDARALVVEGEELLATNPQRALEIFQRVRALLGATPPRLQVDLVRAAAAAGDDVLTQAEHAAWMRLPKRPPAVDAELRVLADRAAERLQSREQRESAAATLIENERRIREAQAQQREAATAQAREADVQFAAAEAQRALRSSESSAADSAIRRIDHVTAIYPDDPRLAELAAARADLVTHAALARRAEASLAAAAAQRQDDERARRARGHYFLGTLKLVGGVAITGAGVALLVAQPADLGQTASIAIGAPAVCLGLGLALVAAPSSFRAGAHAGAPRSWSLAGTVLPGGAFVGAGRAF
jgi:hypothetical protein